MWKSDDSVLDLASSIVSIVASTGVLDDLTIDADGNLATEIFDGTKGPMGLDTSTYAANVIQYDHHEIHGGRAFVYCEQNTLGNEGTRDILLVTPNTTRWSHLTFGFRSSGEANFVFYEGTTTSDDGTAVTPMNRNRNSDHTAGMLVYHTPTVSAVGTQLCTRHFGAGRTPGEERGISEWVLRQNTKYLIRVTSEAASNDISSAFDWYEHTDKSIQTHTESSSSSNSSSSSST